jgi:hypothetical protein
MVGARLCLLPVLPRPAALIPDEHSHLFLAQSLANGRISSPTHPMWRHFETLFVLQRPTYASVYPPVQGMLLAAGLIVFGDPWTGVLAGMAGLCAAIVWMLRAYVTPPWALYGGVLAAAGYGVLSYWTNSYWGGAGAAIGGALVFGSLPRMLSKGRRRDAAILGAGLLILANSRPYEGLLVSLPAAFALALCLRRLPRPPIAVLAGILGAGALATGWYNWRITGSPLRLPYNAYIEQYAAQPAFVWQTPRRAPEYGDRVLRDAHVSFGIEYAEYFTASGAAAKTFRKLAKIAAFYLGPFWPLVLLLFPGIAGERRFRVVLVALAFCLAGILLTVGFQPHYAAPCTSVFVLLLVESFRRIRGQWRRAGAILLIAAPPVWLAFQAVRLSGARAPNSLQHRAAVEARIAGAPGRHVAFLRYAPSHPPGQEWVYNQPDIDGSRLIWARDLGPERNRELMRYYAGRTFWVVEPDHRLPRISPAGRD